MSLGLGNIDAEIFSGGGTSTAMDTTAAKAILIFAGVANAQLPFTITDSAGNTLVTPTGGNTNGANYSLFCRYVTSPITSSTHTWTVSACSFFAACITDTGSVNFDAFSAAAFFDTTADPGSISVTSGGITLSAIASNRSNVFGNYPDPTGYTITAQLNTDTSFAAALQVDRNLSPGSTEQPLWAGNGFQGAVNVIAFKPAGGGTSLHLLPALGVGQ